MLSDTSALLAPIRRERGGKQVATLARRAMVSSATRVETIGRIRRKLPGAEADIRALEMMFVPLDAAEADIAISPLAAHHGVLSLGDCAGLPEGALRTPPLLTADRVWATLGLPVEVRLIR